MRLLVTRPEDEGASFKARLEARGHAVALEPLIRIEPCAADIDFGGVQALIVTSGNALKALKTSPALADARALSLFAVGAATAARAAELGFERVTQGPGTARGLADTIAAAADPRAGALLHLAGDHQAFDLAGALSEHTIRQAVVYRSQAVHALSAATESELKAGRLEGVILMSPRASKIFVSLVQQSGTTGQARRISYFCLSEAVARPLGLLNPGLIKVTQEPNLQEMLALIDRTAQDFL